MTDEKQFGKEVDQDIVSAEDLLRLQTEEELLPIPVGFPTGCTVCTQTCPATSVFV